MNWLFILARAFLYPSSKLKIPAGDVYSRLDTRVHNLGLERTEDLFTHSRAAPFIARALIRYFDDSEAERCLKKGFHHAFEERARIMALRIDPPFGPVPVPAGWHPMDPMILQNMAESGLDTGGISPNPRLLPRIRLILSPIAWGIVFLMRGVHDLVRFHGRPSIVWCHVATDNFWTPQYTRIVFERMKASCGDDTGKTPLLLVRERPHNPIPKDGRPSCIDPADMKIPARKFIRSILMPGFRLVMTVVAAALFRMSDPRISVLAACALIQANTSIKFWRIAFNVRFRYYLDNMEYSENHIIKGMIFRKFGGGIVRWPHSTIDSSGNLTSYLGYELFLSSGAYQASNYGASWYPGGRSISVGFVQRDHRFGAINYVEPPYERAVRDRLSRDKRMIAVFGSSNFSPECFGPPLVEIMAVVREAIEDRDDWFVVIKPKGLNGEYLYEMFDADQRLHAWIEDDDVLCVHYEEDQTEVCGAGWLIENMTIGVGNAGTILTESLARGRPYFAYYPVFERTPLTEMAVAHEYLHDDLDSLRRTIARAIESPSDFRPPSAWFRENLDPFDDDRALDRITAVLFDEADNSRANAATLSDDGPLRRA